MDTAVHNSAFILHSAHQLHVFAIEKAEHKQNDPAHLPLLFW